METPSYITLMSSVLGSGLEDQWDEAGVDSVDLVVRGISGEVVLEDPRLRFYSGDILAT